MNCVRNWKVATMVIGFAVAAGSASAQIRITEYMYSGELAAGGGGGGEFFELTNVGDSPIDMTGYSYDDESAVPGTTDLSVFGVVMPGESVIVAEDPESIFRIDWSLPASVDVLGDNTNNLNRNDAINIFDADDNLVDALDFGDQDFPGSVRAREFSAWPCLDAVGADDPFGWNLSVIGDVQGSYQSAPMTVGSPGLYAEFDCKPDAIGACCSQGQCQEGTEVQCAGIGIYQGDDTLCADVTCPAPSGAVVRITEFMHGGIGSEFIEFTNLDVAPVDFTGWSYSDEGRIPGTVDLSAFGVVAPGESVLIVESDAASFETDWSLSGVAIIGMNTVNIGADDEVNLYDASATLVDRINYGPSKFPSSVDAEGFGAWPCVQGLGMDDIYNWRASSIGDASGAVSSMAGDIGSPGSYTEVTCSPGSCCVDGVCSELTFADCLLAGGLFQGDATNCTDDPCPAPSNANIRITEYMYTGFGGEFLEITNLDNVAVDLTGWSFSDAGIPGVFIISDIGTLNPGESGIVTEDSPSTFRSNWNLPLTAKIASIPTGELGRNDQIAIFDTSGTAVDTLQYGDEDFPGSIRTNEVSGWPCSNAVGNDNIFGWVLSDIGDSQGSFISFAGDLGNPTSFVLDNCGITAVAPLANTIFDVNGAVKACANDADCAAGETGPTPSTVCRDSDGDGNADACYVARQRFLSIVAAPEHTGTNVGYRVSLDTGTAGTAILGFVQDPTNVGGGGNPGPASYDLARIDATPFYRDWSTVTSGVVTIGDCEVSPGNNYLIQSISEGADVGVEGNYSAALALPTPQFHGDVTGGGNPGDPPNGAQGNLVDVFAIVLGFQGTGNEPSDWLDLDPNGGQAAPNLIVSLADAFAGVQAFQQNPYPGPAPTDCP